MGNAGIEKSTDVGEEEDDEREEEGEEEEENVAAVFRTNQVPVLGPRQKKKGEKGANKKWK